MLEAIVNFLNLKLELLNYFEKRHCLSVLVQNDDGLIYPAEYISDGNYDAIDFDAFDGLSYLRVNGEINVDRIDQKYTPKPRVNVTFPLRLVYAVRKDKLTADDAYSFDRVRASIAKQLESDSIDLTLQLDADKVQISTSGYVSDAKEVWDEETNETGQFQPKFEVVFGAMEVNVVVTTRVECIPAECDDFESDILRTFDFCKPSVFDRLTPTQVSCLESEICTPCADATVTNQAEDYSLSIASGATEKLPFGKVKNKEGADVQVDYIPSSQGYIYEALSDELREDYQPHPTLPYTFYSYIGVAPNGSAESSDVWYISRILINPNGTTTTQTATDVAWTDRLTATYT